MSELKFANTKWDARTWTEEQKIKWQEKAFELGYTLGSCREPSCLDSSFFFLEGDGCITQERGDLDYFYRCKEVQKTFEDVFPQEKETLEQEVENKQSVFTHPEWVTALRTMQAHGGLGTTSLTEGKDYKVIDINFLEEELYQYTLSNDEGDIKTFHVDHFYKVTTEECTYLPSVEVQEVEEECYGFENLVKVRDLQAGEGFTLNKLSDEQKQFIKENIPTYTEGTISNTHEIVFWNKRVGGLFGTFGHFNEGKEVSFNDIFKEVN
jgi:hypothetical protein